MEVPRSLRLAALLAGAALGCQGTIVSPGDEAPLPRTPGSGGAGGTGITLPGGGAGGAGGASTSPIDPDAVGPLPLRRLTRREYNNTVRDLLGDDSHPADAFPADHDAEFLFPRAGLVSSQDLSTLQDAAEALAATAEARATTLAPCASGAAEDTCARGFISGFGLRAYRRPLTTPETERLLALYRAGRAAFAPTYAGGIRLIIEAMLQAPSFLYHFEAGPPLPTLEGKLVRLGSYETASRLSYFLWGSMPDPALFQAAADNRLTTAAEIETQARRLLADARARETVTTFVEEWLNLDQVAERPKDPAVYPEFKDDLKAAMVAETRAFVGNVVFDGDGRLGSMLTANFSFVNAALGPLYGMTGIQGTDLKRSLMDTTQRSGLLTHAAFLTVTGSTSGSNPVKRGKKIYERLLCGTLPPPPPNVPTPRPASEGGTTRERFAEHGQSKCAVGCHSLMDPIGFAFEHYDGIGRYRTLDNGKMVDSAGTLTLDGAARTFTDARELSQLLASSETVNRCLVTQMMRFALGRPETEGDRASLETAAAAAARGGGSIRELMVGVVVSRSWRYRTTAAGEMLP